MLGIRIIKKYPNRRLYDTEKSRYIRLSDVRDLVLGDVAFTVVDTRTGDDITRSILLQVIAEEEQKREPIMNRAFLSQVIHAYECVPPEGIGGYLEQCLQTYLERSQPVAQVHRGRWTSVQDEGNRRAEVDAERLLAGRDDAAFAEDRKKAG